MFPSRICAKSVMLILDKDIITQAKKQKINLSSFLEIRLIDYLGEKRYATIGKGASIY